MQVLANRAVSVEVQQDFMVAGSDSKSLEKAIEVVHRTGKIAVNIDFSVARRHLQSNITTACGSV